VPLSHCTTTLGRARGSLTHEQTQQQPGGGCSETAGGKGRCCGGQRLGFSTFFVTRIVVYELWAHIECVKSCSYKQTSLAGGAKLERGLAAAALLQRAALATITEFNHGQRLSCIRDMYG